MHDPLLDDPHDDRSPACDPVGAFNIEYERQVVIRSWHDPILPSLVLDRQMATYSKDRRPCIRRAGPSQRARTYLGRASDP
jgi:hypothetical protein